jgi:hypothetical protein
LLISTAGSRPASAEQEGEATAVKIRHPETGQELDIPEDEDFDATYRPQGFVPADDEAAAGGDAATNLGAMTRDELNARAAEAGVDSPESLPNKAAVVEAIEGAGTPQE